MKELVTLGLEVQEFFDEQNFGLHIKISCKDAKESAYWLRLIRETNKPKFEPDANVLINEAIELKKIFSSILNKK